MGSMNVYPENTMAAFHNLLAHPVHLGDWHVVLAEIMFPTSVENFRANEYFQYTPNVPMKTFSNQILMEFKYRARALKTMQNSLW